MVSSRFSWAEALDPCHGIPDRRPLVRQEGHAGAVAQAAAVELQRLRLPEAAQLDLDGAVLADGEGHVVPPWRYVAHRITGLLRRHKHSTVFDSRLCNKYSINLYSQ